MGRVHTKRTRFSIAARQGKARFFLALLPRDNDFTLPLLRQHTNQALEARGRKSGSGGARRSITKEKNGGGLAVVVNFRVKKKKKTHTHKQTKKQCCGGEI